MREFWSRRAGAAPVTNQSHGCSSFTILLTGEAKTNQRSLSWTLPHPGCKHCSQSCSTFSADTSGGAGWTPQFRSVPFLPFITQFLINSAAGNWVSHCCPAGAKHSSHFHLQLEGDGFGSLQEGDGFGSLLHSSSPGMLHKLPQLPAPPKKRLQNINPHYNLLASARTAESRIAPREQLLLWLTSSCLDGQSVILGQDVIDNMNFLQNFRLQAGCSWKQ